MNKPLKIYIAGPYSAETEEQRLRNVKAAIDAGVRLFLKGHFPYVPHLTHFVDERAKEIGVSFSWEDYIKWDRAWMDFCDGLLFLGSSRGADFELQIAKDLGKQIFYSVDEIAAVKGEEETKPRIF